jgi:shikimate dehydrogenase
MEPRISFVTLAVKDLAATRRFYIDGLGWPPALDVPGEVLMIQVGEHLVLSLWDAAAFAAEVGPITGGEGVPPVTLAHNVSTREEVDSVLAAARAVRADPVGAAEDRDWGGYTGYFADPDGFRWEIAWNPGDIGRMVLPSSRPELNRDTVLCISLAARPSNIGTRFHNYLYDEIGLDFVYKAFTTTDLTAAIAGVRGLGIRGCSVSMPFKEDVLALVDSVDPSAAALGSANTIVNEGGHLCASNTDYIAAAALVADLPRTPLLLRGSGGMAKAVATALRDAGFTEGTIVARNETAGRTLAAALGWSWQAEVGGATAALLINVTPIGMAGGAESDQVSFAEATVAAAETVFDVVAMPSETPLIRSARAAGKRVITGAEVIALQAAEQFAAYTGVRPSAEQVARASAYSRL